VTRVYLSLGSNLGDRLALLRAAVQRLRESADVDVVAASPLYESEPWEAEPGRAGSEQRWYLNCVVAVDTGLPPRALLDRVRGIEDALGRVRPPGTPEARRFAPRTVDIDILFYGNEVISGPDDLHVPHLMLAERAFVLRPLADIAPDFTHPTLYRRVSELLDELADEHEVRRGAFPTHWLEG
jgi:2-amino-4-hydroxy-6-hydroxymethyldihydropteridine diphosphokinase